MSWRRRRTERGGGITHYAKSSENRDIDTEAVLLDKLRRCYRFHCSPQRTTMKSRARGIQHSVCPEDEIAQAMQAILKRDEQKKRRKQGGGGRGGGRGRWLATPPVEAAMPPVEDGVEERRLVGYLQFQL
eukprot:g39682.t1